MPNSFKFADWITMESLRHLKNKLIVAEKFNTEYNTEENRQKAADAAEAARIQAEAAYDSLRKAIADAVKKDDCKCNKGDPLCSCL